MFYFVLFTAAAVDMNEIKSLTVYKDLYRVFFFCSEYMYVSVHIYKHLALFFFCCCKVFSPLFTLTLLDHVVLVSSASTTNTREIKNRFRPEPVDRPERDRVEKKIPEGRHQAPQKLSKRNQKIVFFVDFFYVYMIFCLWFFFCLLFFVCFPRFVLISIRKTTITYIQYFDVSFVFVLQ